MFVPLSLKRLAAVFAASILISVLLVAQVYARPVLRQGSVGPQVVVAQHILHQIGKLPSAPDGIFGQMTLEAVREYQKSRGLQADGIIGSETWKQLNEDAKITSAQGTVELVHWDVAKDIYTNFKVVTIVDVRTGKRFQARRYYGQYHADTEPYTAEDTKILQEIYGGGSWDRRPIIVEVDGRRLAASMNGMAHGGGAIPDNQFNGHFCVHFIGSRLHLNGRIDLEHQSAVLEAAGYDSQPRLWLATR